MTKTENMLSRRAKLAREFSNAFETRNREDGSKYSCLRDSSPEWMKDAIYAAHDNGDMVPNDWSYRLIRSLTESIADSLEYDNTVDLFEDTHFGAIERAVPDYNSELADWLGSSVYRFTYCDEASAESGAPDDTMDTRIKAGIRYECDMIYSVIAQAITKAAE